MKQTFRLLVVDDKELDRNGICYLIEQNQLPILVTTAGSADEALQILCQSKYDILLSDIKMPGKSGLELIKDARKIQPALKCVVFSSFDNFQYAQSAIDVGVTKYLLKPIKVDLFLDCFHRLMNEVSEESVENEIRYIYDFISAIPSAQASQTIEMISGYLFLLDFVHPFFSKPDFVSILPPLPTDIMQIPLNEFQCLFFAAQEEAAQKYILELKEKLSDTDNFCLITYGGHFTDSKELRSLYDEMEQCSTAKFYLVENEIVYLDDQTHHLTESDIQLIWENCEKIAKYAVRHEFNSADDLLDQLFSKQQLNHNLPIAILKSACANIARICLWKNDEHRGQFIPFLLAIDKNNNVEELKNTVYEIIHTSSVDNSETLAIQKALDIIHQKYMEDISLDSLATEVFLSSCYFSYLFKKTTGVNFLKYLTNYRVERAKDLLRSTQLRIGEICEQVGYSNRSYFCQIFRNHCGMSPMQYREMKQYHEKTT